jgi:hypothetical protein
MRHTLLGRRKRGFGFDGINRRDPVQRLAGDGGFGVLPLIEEFASAVRPTGNFGNRTGFGPLCTIQRGKACVAIRLQKSAELRKMRGRMRAAAVGAVEIGGGWRGIAAKRPVVTHVNPQTAGGSAAEAWLQHRNRGVVTMDFVASKNMPPDCLDQRIEQPSRLAHPIA